jgi:prolyl oligopeptidase
MKTLFQIALIGFIATITSAASAQSTLPSAPPLAMVKPVVDDYFGVKITDPYRYLENLKDPEVQSWMKGQAEYSRAGLDRIPGRASLLADVEKYIDSAPSHVASVNRMVGGRYFYLKTLAGQSLAKLYMREGLDGKEVLLVDTDKYKGPKGEPAAINYYFPAPDAKHVAYGISQGGGEIAVMHIRDVDTGNEAAETIDRTWEPTISWLPDNQSFFYNQMQKLAPDASPLELEQRSKVYLHRIGQPVENDPAVFGIGVNKDVQISPVDLPFIATRPDSDFAIGVIEHGVQRENTIYVLPLAAVGKPDAHWVKICDIEDQVIDFTFHGDDLYLLSHKDAARYKILRTSLKQPDVVKAAVIIPEGQTVLHELTCMADGLYVLELDAGIGRIIRVPYGGKTQRIPLPMEGTVYLEGSDPRLPGVIFGMTSWVKSGQIYEYDATKNSVTPTNLQPLGPFDSPDDLTAVEVSVPSYDGVPVPLSIIYKKGTKLDGSNPLALSAYGAYGITSDPGFSLSALAWYQRGGIRAVAHVRGGGENGEEWHLGGYKLTKPNTWRDLIACAQYLIDQKYTSTPRLGIYGGSAGGITIGRALTARPDLFAAAIPMVGLENSVRSETYPNGVPNIPEFGSVATQEGFEDLYAMDSYLHVRDGVAYPAVMLTAGMNDPRVTPWMPSKMAARLQAANTSGKPILFRLDYVNGHGIGASKSQQAELTADIYSFFLWQFGQAGFQPN